MQVAISGVIQPFPPSNPRKEKIYAKKIINNFQGHYDGCARAMCGCVGDCEYVCNTENVSVLERASCESEGDGVTEGESDNVVSGVVEGDSD